jgi:hypothetical protein
MGVQSFVPSGGGKPGQTFVGQIHMTFAARVWNQSGGPGFYRTESSGGKAGYVYYLGPSPTVVVPVGAVAQIDNAFTSIKVIGNQFDMISLYKAQVKPTSSTSLSSQITTITTSGTYKFNSNQVGFIDALIIGGGGGASHHSAGGGAGGIVLLKSFPMEIGANISVTVGSGGSASGGSSSPGGDSVFLNHVALGGANAKDGAGPGNSGGSGAGGNVASAQAGTFAGGLANQPGYTIGQTQQSLWISTSSDALNQVNSSPLQAQYALGTGHNGGSCVGSGHCGGGGGGGGGVGESVNNTGGIGGIGHTNNFSGVSTLYAVGGSGSKHSNQYDAPVQTGWTLSGYGMGGRSQHNTANPGSQGIVIVRTFQGG